MNSRVFLCLPLRLFCSLQSHEVADTSPCVPRVANFLKEHIEVATGKLKAPFMCEYPPSHVPLTGNMGKKNL